MKMRNGMIAGITGLAFAASIYRMPESHKLIKIGNGENLSFLYFYNKKELSLGTGTRIADCNNDHIPDITQTYVLARGIGAFFLKRQAGNEERTLFNESIKKAVKK
ncbi:hypothetical protein HY450_03485 [Candidatus Pacearchaeota archaeon]|nr:hypothetical protein [Candidatus Pacearchaeota archaeon]